MSFARRTASATWRLLREAGGVAFRGLPMLFCSVVLTILVTWWLHHRLEAKSQAWIHANQDPSYVAIAQQLSRWGELNMAPLIALVLVALAGWKLRDAALRWAAGAGVLAGCMGGILANLVKIIVGRPRPSTNIPDGIHWFHTGWDYASFPSGHATHCFAIVAAVIVLAPRTGVALALGAIAVAWSRWYLIRHYITDVWAGGCLGVMVGLCFGFAAYRIYWRNRNETAVTDHTSNDAAHR